MKVAVIIRLSALGDVLLTAPAVSALAAINYTFRIRYGIIPLIPVSLLLAWSFGLVAESWEGKARVFPKWAGPALASLLVGSIGRRAQFWRGIVAVLLVCAMQGSAYGALSATIRTPGFWPLLYAVPLTPTLLALSLLRLPRLGNPFLIRLRAAHP